MGHKFSIQKECDSHCYKQWYVYDKMAGNRRCKELDLLVAVDLLHYCPCNRISCSFVDEVSSVHVNNEQPYIR
ncbi:MAG: hypothetical protein LBQ05_02285 [Christensenellaceae bacterium]|jgi:predicted P-loop ATPase/GTPase|nr:hypothetical protein [Christensenellaceae bacterium]